jgi:hypothetical protein
MVITAIPKNNGGMLILTIYNDDFSVRSTVTVESGAIPFKSDFADDSDPSSSQKYTNKRIRSARSASVQFHERENTYFSNAQICREEITELWYSRFETRQFRKVAGAMGRAIASVEREHIQSSSSSSSLLLSSSFKSVLQRTLDACRKNCSCVLLEDDATAEEQDNTKTSTTTILTAQAQQALHQRLSESMEHLGLERLAVRALGDDCHDRRRNLCTMLLALQKTLNQQECLNNNNLDAGTNRHHALSKAELIRARCQAISRPSRHFAREIAQAYYADSMQTTTNAMK